MPVYVNSKFYLILLIVGLAVTGSLSLQADSGEQRNFATEVSNADIDSQNDALLLNAQIHYHLTVRAREALNNGIPLYWNVLIKVQQQHNWLWDETIRNHSIRYQLQYHALLNKYIVTNVNTQQSESFTSLINALAGMSSIRGFNLIDRTSLADDDTYQVKIKVIFDRESLPLPLRPISYINPQWYLSSNWSVWPLQK